MHKTLVSMTVMNGFTFIIVATVDNYRVDKVLILNKSGLGVAPNSSFSSGQSLLPSSFKVLIDFLSTCRLGIQGHPSSII
jgi:hypothetical protein